MKISEILGQSYSLDIEVGDKIRVGKWKTKRATVTEFSKDDHNQPVLHTTKENHKLFKPRIYKLEEQQGLRAYHGTRSSKLVFKLGHTGNNAHTFGHYDSQRWGAFFTDNPNFARMYGEVSEYSLNVHHILDCDNDNNVLWDFVQSLDAFDSDERPIWQEGRALLRDNPPHFWQCFENEFGERFVAYLQGLGFDSARFEEYNNDDGGTEHKSHTTVVFDINSIYVAASSVLS